MFGKKMILLVSLLVLLTSCKHDTKKENKVGISTNTTAKKNEDKSSSYSIDLPFKLDSLSTYLIYPIRKLSTTEPRKTITRSYDDNSQFTNGLRNLIFQEILTEKTHLLTKDKIKINAYEQLYNDFKESEDIILYQIIDHFPEDKDELILTHLYLGSSDGKVFKKITKENETLTSWKYISETKKVYYKTTEDSDNNNKLNHLDKTHMYSISISSFKVKEILPY